MQQVVLAGLIAGALAVGQSPAASAQATSGQATTGQTTTGQGTTGETRQGTTHRPRGPQPAGPRPLPARRRSARCASPAPSRRMASRWPPAATPSPHRRTGPPRRQGSGPFARALGRVPAGQPGEGTRGRDHRPRKRHRAGLGGQTRPERQRARRDAERQRLRAGLDQPGRQQLPDPLAAGLIIAGSGWIGINAQCTMQNAQCKRSRSQFRAKATFSCIVAFCIVHCIVHCAFDVTPQPSRRTARDAGGCRGGW